MGMKKRKPQTSQTRTDLLFEIVSSLSVMSVWSVVKILKGVEVKRL
jgi:hypothetical protein